MKKAIILMRIGGGKSEPYWVQCYVTRGLAQELAKNKPMEYRLPQ